MSKVTCMILAAGQGTRMNSERPKVLFDLLGKPVLVRLLESLVKGPQATFLIVVGKESQVLREKLGAALPKVKLAFAVQKEQRGTGHAVAAGLPSVARTSSQVLVVNGDLPLLTAGSVARIADVHRREGAAVTIATSVLDDPSGYGRILRKSSGRILGIREERDCSPSEREIHQVNAGIYCFARSFLEANIVRLSSSNSQKEFYLTDLVELASMSTGLPVAEAEVPGEEIAGINTRGDMASIEQILLGRVRERHMLAGATIRLPHTVWIDEDVEIGRDVVIEPCAILRRGTSIGRDCTVGAGCILDNARLEDGARMEPYSVAVDSIVRAGAVVGPFARLRPGSDVGRNARIGNFVELKNTVIGEESKANHLSYLGDGVIGRGVNVGAGTIFCNYDGVGKHRTVLDDDVFIGSDSQMVAPVRIGKGSYVGSGSTITHDVPPDSLALARARQVTKQGRAHVLKEFLTSRGKAAGEPASKDPEQHELRKKRRRRRRRRKTETS